MQSVFRLMVAGGALVLMQAPAFAQSGPTPQQIQGQIAAGQAQTALSELQPTLQAHPTSGVAWYLQAEAQDALGNEGGASQSLAKARQYAPGLPFAKPSAVAALQNHINGGGQTATNPPLNAPAPHRGISPTLLVIGGLAVLFILFRMFSRSRRRMMMPGAGYPGQNVGPMGGPMGGPGYGPGYGGGMGGGMGGSILGGLAAGAGFAAGERVIDDVMGGRGGNDQNQVNDPPVNDRDDGLQGDPGWGDNSGNIDNGGTIDSGGGFDPGNNW